jgi:hypothetical protein
VSFYRNNYYGGQRPDRSDPCPRGGIGEATYCGIKARYGYWPKTFLSLVEKHYGGQIPTRFIALANKLALERPWELPPDPSEGLPPTITLVDRNGNVIARWRPSQEEWDDAATAARTAQTERG